MTLPGKWPARSARSAIPNFQLHLSHIHLRVRDLQSAAAFYAGKLGFNEISRSDSRIDLAVSPKAPPILTLTGEPTAPTEPRDAAGLYHAALLLPDRTALAHWLRQTVDAGVTFAGFADHGVSEAIYLSDPEGNGLEFYVDRPRSAWPRSGGELAMVTDPLDLRSLTREPARPGAPAIDPASAWGHLHLRVTDLDESSNYYESVLGLEVTQSSFPGARFLAADGYHHHLGLNTWGHPRRKRPADATGLVSATFRTARTSARKAVRDPDDMEIILEPA